MRFTKQEITPEKQELMKLSAYDALIQLEQEQLPVNTMGIDPKKSNIFILPAQLIADKASRRKKYIASCKSGYVMYTGGTDEHYVLLYDENETDENIRWIIAKLLSYIKLGIARQYPKKYLPVNFLPDEEYEEFAYQFTCPDIILRECNIISTEDIFKQCKIPLKNAKGKSGRISLENTISCFCSSLEKKLKENFSQFIKFFLSDDDTFSLTEKK